MMSAMREMRELASRALADPLKRVGNGPLQHMQLRSQGHYWRLLASVNL